MVKGVIERKKKKFKKKKKMENLGFNSCDLRVSGRIRASSPPTSPTSIKEWMGIFIDAYCTTRMTHGALTRREEKRRRGEEKRRAA